MTGKIQGEGDYDAARRFNESERQFVKKKGVPRQPAVTPKEERELQDAEEQGKSRGKERRHDATDASLFRDRLSQPRS